MKAMAAWAVPIALLFLPEYNFTLGNNSIGCPAGYNYSYEYSACLRNVGIDEATATLLPVIVLGFLGIIYISKKYIEPKIKKKV